MKNYTTDAPAWSDTIPVVEQNDLVNAENDSAAAKQLLQNIMVLAATKVDKEDGKSLVSDAERNLWNMIYEQATGYTDQKIAGLINGAPSTLDTLGEIAAAMGENADVVEALETAIGTKANQTEMESLLGMKLDKTGDTKDNIITLASSDTTTPSGWTDVAVLKSGETHKSFAQKVSTMFKNLRYLWKLCGNTDIAQIGDGTITGALDALNTGIARKDYDFTAISNSYVELGATEIYKIAGVHIVTLHLNVVKIIPNWTNIKIFKISDWDGRAGNIMMGVLGAPNQPIAYISIAADGTATMIFHSGISVANVRMFANGAF